jgi:hypothetical protein
LGVFAASFANEAITPLTIGVIFPFWISVILFGILLLTTGPKLSPGRRLMFVFFVPGYIYHQLLYNDAGFSHSIKEYFGYFLSAHKRHSFFCCNFCVVY